MEAHLNGTVPNYGDIITHIMNTVNPSILKRVHQKDIDFFIYLKFSLVLTFEPVEQGLLFIIQRKLWSMRLLGWINTAVSDRMSPKDRTKIMKTIKILEACCVEQFHSECVNRDNTL